MQKGNKQSKKAEALKGIKIEEFKNYSEQWEKVSVDVSKGEYLEGDLHINM